jgi:plastocyanin
MKGFLIAATLILFIVLYGCSAQAPLPDTTDKQPSTAPQTGGGLSIKADVAISGFAFDPNTLTIPKGATVIWTNMDSAPHNIVSDTGDEINSATFSKGETFAHTFSTPGTYAYHCGVHPSMKGTVVVG